MATPIPLANYLSRTLKRAGPARALALLLIAIGIPVAAALAASPPASASNPPNPFVSCSPSAGYAYEPGASIPVSCELRETANPRNIGFAVSLYRSGATGTMLQNARRVKVYQPAWELGQRVNSSIRVPVSTPIGSRLTLVTGLYTAAGRSLGYTETRIEIVDLERFRALISQWAALARDLLERAERSRETASTSDQQCSSGVTATAVKAGATTSGVVIGTHAGMVAGCAIGGVFGSFLPGVGTIAGCIAGSIVGALGGGPTGGYIGHEVGEGISCR